MRSSRCGLLLVLVAVCRGQGTVTNGSFEGYPALTLSNGKLNATVLLTGSTVASVTLADDVEKLNPLWNPIRLDRQAGQAANFERGAGQFVCVDGFGQPSREERAAGLPMHGEAHVQRFTEQSTSEGKVTSISLTANLPIAHEKFTRTFQTVAGENVIFIESHLENGLGFDRPVNWAEHATIGSPFLQSGVTVVDVSGSRSRTRPYEGSGSYGSMQRRLASGRDFTWPTAPGLDGEPIDLRQTPDHPHYMDHAVTLLDPHREWEWVTAINKEKHLILGYLFRRDEYPWLQYWGDYPPSGEGARGMEFSTQPFDVPRKEAITLGTLFGAPTVRWLPAKSTIGSKFLLFYARVPAGFDQVDDIEVANGNITLEDRVHAKRISLKASLL